jgi:hypothetical protein
VPDVYLNAQRLIYWSEKVIAHLHEIKQLTGSGADDLESERNERVPSATNHVAEDQYAVFAWSLLGVLDFARIGVGRDRDYAIGPTQALWRL